MLGLPSMAEVRIMGLHRTHRKHQDQLDAAHTKARNRIFKDRERARRWHAA